LWSSTRLSLAAIALSHDYDRGEKPLARRSRSAYQRHAVSRTALLEPGTGADKKSLKETLDIVENCYSAVERMPTWPVHIRLALQVAVSNALLVLPLMAQVNWWNLLDWLGRHLGLSAS